MKTLAFRGPGIPCSIARVRRLEAGELAPEERARVLAHVADCARCRESQGQLDAERAALEATLPFGPFAAGVAERLARARAPRPPRRRHLVGLLVAASVPLAAMVPLALAVRAPRRADVDAVSVAGARAKGDAELTVYVRDGLEARVLAPGEPVPAGVALRIALARTARAHAAVALVDEDGPTLLYAGPARPGPLADAFEWTGRDGSLVLVLDDAPVDTTALALRLSARGVVAASPRPAAEVIVRPLGRRR